MSRSFRKNPINKFNDAVMKRKANRSIRRSLKSGNIEEIEDGSFYKKIFNSYNISDYTYRYFSEDDDNQYKIESLRK